MRVYHSIGKVKKLRNKAREEGYERIFIQLNRTIPELRLFKDNIIEADEYNKNTQTYTVYTGYGNVKIWKSSCKPIR